MSVRNTLTYSSYVDSSTNELGRVQDFANKQISQISNQIPIKNASTVTVNVLTTDTVVQHGLGRVPNGYLIIDRDGAGVVFTSPSSNPSPESQLILRASVAVNVKVMVF